MRSGAGYTCSCSFFYQPQHSDIDTGSGTAGGSYEQSNTCARLSLSGILVIFSLCAAVVFALISYLYWSYYRGQKDRYLLELRENLLAGGEDEHGYSK